MTRDERIETEITGEAAQAYARRGACPTLARPMRTGDGLLARLRPQGGILTVDQCALLAHAATRCGNGLLEITARGSLQIRGLSPETVEPFAEAVDAAGIIVSPNPVIELPPLHGEAFGDVADAAAMELALRDRLAEHLQAPGLAPKLSIIVDGGGRFDLADVTADIRLLAVTAGKWVVAIAGDGASARPVAAGSVDEAIAAVGELLKLLLSIGWQKRCRDISPERLSSTFPEMHAISHHPCMGETPSVGVNAVEDGMAVIGLKLRFGQIQAADLLAFLIFLGDLDVGDIRPAPDRCLFVTGLSEEDAATVRQSAERFGLSANRDDLSSRIATCAGAGACASSFYAAKALAGALIEGCPEILDGSLDVHLSGCAKGCAHPRRAFTVAGAENGYNLVLDGLASDAPDAQIAGSHINSAIERLSRLIKNERQAGESARACLDRVGTATITRALRQE
ncbi:precorrin-3B synthase [Rhizobium metallidurans]|uniref:Precorrin-3B synthase n=1 Tax=Rhizobium metallidurans TaxID=1265931 RepID=A0A7W6CQ81_9HYPH|nr:precorrin-3B synthase [Rhizobium metallidurans]MBB3963123.1 precorrin-3B synthase [Rhizobium metallidurans]